MPPVLGPESPSPTRLKSWAGSIGTTVSPSTMHSSETSGPSRNDSNSTGCPASSRLAACARAASRSAVTTTPLPAARPSSLTTHAGSPRAGSEPVQRGVEVCGVVDDLAGCGAHARGRHDVLGEGFRTLDAGGFLRRAEACDARGPHRVGHAEHQRHFRPDHHQVGTDPLGELRDGVTRGDVDVVLVGDDRGAGVARRDGELLDLRVFSQRQQQCMFTGTGSDHEDAHSCQPYRPYT